LELGCGDGTNLIAIAQSLPQASLSGIDFSAKQIAMGQTVIEAIQCANITLKQLDFDEIDESYGKFDYIIAHGLYSWVPKEKPDTVLNIIQRHLAANGIAYISYNIYPGWHMENVVRDMMMYHMQQLPEMSFPIRMMQAKGIVQFLANFRQQSDSAFDVLLQEKVQQLATLSDNYLSHDLLEADNHPVYFHQFIKQATQLDWKILPECYIAALVIVSSIVAHQCPFIAHFKELVGFVKKLVGYKNTFDEMMTNAYIATHLQTEYAAISRLRQEPTQFKKADGEVLALKHPLTQAAIRYLTNVYPHCVSFEACHQLLSKHRPAEALFVSDMAFYRVEDETVGDDVVNRWVVFAKGDVFLGKLVLVVGCDKRVVAGFEFGE